MTLSTVADALHLADDRLPWLEALERLGPPAGGVKLATGHQLVAELSRLGIVEPDLSAVASAMPEPGAQPELWWLLERCVNQVQRSIGDWDAMTPMPSLPAELGMPGRCFWIAVFLAATESAHQWHTLQGIPDEVSWSTLADLGRQVARCRRRTGATGLDQQFWVSLAYRGALYELGRLQFNPFRLRTGMAGPLFWYEDGGPGRRVGDAALGVHIPSGSPLEPAECDASFKAAAPFFEQYFPQHASRVAVCTSWLLDDQLAQYLPPTSNIVQFQRRFELVPGVQDNDDEFFRWVFDRVPASLDELSPRTELERVVVQHVRSGGHWRLRTGWLQLPDF